MVFETRPPTAGDVTRHEVIDGQQPMTTLQVLLDAVHEVVEASGYEHHAEALEDLIHNRSKAFAGKRERFKLWPSQADRQLCSGAAVGDRDELDVWVEGVYAGRLHRRDADADFSYDPSYRGHGPRL